MKLNRTYRVRDTWFAVCCGLIGYSGVSDAQTSSAGIAPSKISDSDYRFTMTACKITMDINPQRGARISALKFANNTIIMPYGCDANSNNGSAACNGSGSTFWTSPQATWLPHSWPPVTAVDSDAYIPVIEDDHLVLLGKADSLSGISVEKDFSVDEQSCVLTLRYTIKTSHPNSVAPWEITRVPRGGIAFFPLGDRTKLMAGPLSAYITKTTGPDVVWFDDTAEQVPLSKSGAKLIADGADGWLAYASGNVLFIKKFHDVLPALLAPNEGDIEIYPGSDFLELEVQGAYTALASGDKLPWTVQWRAVAIPDSVIIASGSASLLEFVQQQVSK